MTWQPDESLCPPVIVESLKAYAQGRPTGDFLRAVLSNDLHSAVMRADAINGPALQHIVAFVRANLPMAAWGSLERVEKWLAAKREERKAVVARCEP